ncbi:MAG: hypothetical protein Q8S03_04705 [Brevundimonas sp.]|uniref:hypothetical protein n=1 Tax=Brevundimonas sp. TaxID=1871086 RepID=UPI002735F52A|nr:hypothetical protein [Brevundimonas sp.]MBX9616981.1 hypothetical protein [Caulobacteraceae bacterium]MDP3403969.1 hypothetical protein [Brevundimonas sp.]
MNRFLTMRRLSILFFSLFAVLISGALAYERFYVAPAEKCEQTGRWWYAEGRECVQPLYLPDITGRPEGVTRAEASDQQNRELLAIEDRLAAERAARDAATARDRADYESKTGG